MPTPPTTPTARWEHYAHDADIGVRGLGPTLASAFEQAALAMAAVVTDPAQVSPDRAVEIACEAPDPELLLVDWLNALVFRMAVDHLLFGRFSVTIDGPRLRATAWGEPASPGRHRPAVEVKGATFTTLRVAHTDDGGWIAQTVVDV